MHHFSALPGSRPSVPALDGVVLTSAGVEAFDCPVCDAPRDLVPPDCDDHRGDCPDRACAVCGFAVVLGSPGSAPAASAASALSAPPALPAVSALPALSAPPAVSGHPSHRASSDATHRSAPSEKTA